MPILHWVAWNLCKVLVREFSPFSRGLIATALVCSETLIFIPLLAESCLRAARFSSLNTTAIRKTSWQLSHLSDFHPQHRMNPPSAWCTGIFNSFLLITSSSLCSDLPATVRERGSNKYGRGLLCIYNFCCWQSLKSASIFPWIIPQNPSTMF